MFVGLAPIFLSSAGRGEDLQSWRKQPSIRYTLSKTVGRKRRRCTIRFSLVSCSSNEVNGSLPASWRSSDEEIERKRQYLERKYRFFEKEFAKIHSCTFCKGSGKLPCNFCNGTGFMTLGDTLLCSASGNCDCIVCNAQGEVDCEHCRGTGNVAAWL